MTHFANILKFSILVVGTDPGLKDLHHSLLWQKIKLGISCEMQVDVCEVLADILKMKQKIEHDFVVLTFDMAMYDCLKEVKEAIKSLRNQIFMHRVCLLSVADLPSRKHALQYKDIRKLREKYSLPLISSDIRCQSKCQYVAERLLILASSVVGLRSGLPTIV